MGALADSLENAKQAADWLGAVDIAERLIESSPSTVAYRYERALAYAKAGSPHYARMNFDGDRLKERSRQQPDALRIDILSLNARLLKDAARSKNDFRDAAQAYVEADGRDPYPLVNAATLFALSGDLAKARTYAERAEKNLAGRPENYWREATRAEAQIVLGNEPAAAAALVRAAAMPDCELASSASTRKQLRALLSALGWSFEILNPLQNLVPGTIHFVGRRFVEHSTQEPELAARVKSYLQDRHVQFGFGSLAAGSDILVAEALIERGSQLTIVLPYNIDEFVERSVATMGESWRVRFHDVLAILRAKEKQAGRTFVHFATKDDDRYLDDDMLYGYASRFAMGLATLQSQALFDGPLRQLALWDRETDTPSPLAGTLHDVTAWHDAGNETDSISVPRSGSVALTPPAKSFREARALMFGDFHGFSKLGEAQLVSFVGDVMGRVAASLRPFAKNIAFRNTWGDGLYIVFDSAPAAALCALAMQRAMSGIPLAALGFKDDLLLRLGVHFGPVRRLTDPVTERDSFFGEHVSRTARIEPITIPGAVYVTERFAAELALNPVNTVTCEYVGAIPLAKNYMTSRIYVLRSEHVPDDG